MAQNNVDGFYNTLINLVANRPVIYDKSDSFFYCKTSKDNAWKEIADKCDKPVLECQTKWQCLRERFARECKKIEIFGINSDKLKPEWPFYKSLLFLKESAKHMKNPTTESKLKRQERDPLCLEDSAVEDVPKKKKKRTNSIEVKQEDANEEYNNYEYQDNLDEDADDNGDVIEDTLGEPVDEVADEVMHDGVEDSIEEDCYDGVDDSVDNSVDDAVDADDEDYVDDADDGSYDDTEESTKPEDRKHNDGSVEDEEDLTTLQKYKISFDQIYRKFGETLEKIEKSSYHKKETLTEQDIFIKNISSLLNDLPEAAKDIFKGEVYSEIYQLRAQNPQKKNL